MIANVSVTAETSSADDQDVRAALRQSFIRPPKTRSTWIFSSGNQFGQGPSNGPMLPAGRWAVAWSGGKPPRKSHPCSIERTSAQAVGTALVGLRHGARLDLASQGSDDLSHVRLVEPCVKR